MRTLTLFIAAALLCAEDRFVYPVPPPDQVEVRRNVAYGDSVLMDFYRPAGKAGRLPVIVFLNARTGSQRDWAGYVGWARAATAHGFAAINPDTNAAKLEETFDALLAYLRSHADNLGVDPARVILFAESGHVNAGWPLAMDPKRTSLKAAIFYYGAAAQPAFRPDLPVLLVRAGLDRPPLNRAIDGIAAEAARQNVPFTLWNHAGGYHGFEVRNDDDTTRAVIEQTFQFAKAASAPEYHAALARTRTEAEAAGAVAREDFERAVTLYAGLAERSPRSATLLLAYGEALVGAKKYAEALAVFDRVKALGGVGPRDLALPAASAAALAGDAEKAIAWLASIPERFRPRVLADLPAFAGIRDRPAFRALFQ